MGFGISAKGLQIRMGQLMQELKMPKAFGGKIPGYDWFLGLKKRHPDLSLRRPEKLSSCRSKMLNRDVMDKYFCELGKVMNELDLLYKPHLIWNADEFGFQMEHKPVARKGVRSVPSRTSSSRESVSVLVTCNAAGRTMSPMLVVKGKTRKCLQSWDVESFPDAIWTYQQNAFMEDTLGVEWFTSIFLRECGHERPQLLILDGHHSHQVLGVLEAAKCNDIHIMAIPPHTSHRSQPMDVGVFSALQRMYDRLCSEYMVQSPFHIINKQSWPKLFKQAYDQAVTQENITSGFRGSGIYPLNSSAIPAAAYLPSLPFGENETENVAEAPSNTNEAVESSHSLSHDAESISEQSVNGNEQLTPVTANDWPVANCVAIMLSDEPEQTADGLAFNVLMAGEPGRQTEGVTCLAPSRDFDSPIATSPSTSAVQFQAASWDTIIEEIMLPSKPSCSVSTKPVQTTPSTHGG